jgi:hypothetical protein
LFSQLGDSTAPAGFVRFIMPFVVLIVPTALMGATLPLVMKSSLTRIDGPRDPRRTVVCEQHGRRDRRRARGRALPDSADRVAPVVSPRRHGQCGGRDVRADPVADPRAWSPPGRPGNHRPDAIVPTNAGANNLYSAEYFELVHDALAPGGIALHWNGGGNATEYVLILRAFVKAFPNTSL